MSLLADSWSSWHRLSSRYTCRYHTSTVIASWGQSSRDVIICHHWTSKGRWGVSAGVSIRRCVILPVGLLPNRTGGRMLTDWWRDAAGPTADCWKADDRLSITQDVRWWGSRILPTKVLNRSHFISFKCVFKLRFAVNLLVLSQLQTYYPPNWCSAD